MTIVDPEEAFDGVALFLIPHMDDEILGCGGTIARIRRKERLFFIYATDGSLSPSPPRHLEGGSPSDEIRRVREGEAKEALGSLGVPSSNIVFLGFPDGSLSASVADLEHCIREGVLRWNPRFVFTPFRYDQHPDHVALYRGVQAMVKKISPTFQWFEYFVYFKWRLIPCGDVRTCIRSDQLVAVEIAQVTSQKRAALACFKSQTTRYWPGQRRPILTPELLSEVCRNPEVFLRSDPLLAGRKIFDRFRWWIPMAHRLEPRLKGGKEHLISLWHRLWWQNEFKA